MRKKIISLIVCVASFVTGTGITSLISNSNCRLPDLLLIKTFEAHRSEFDLLVKIANEDPQIHVINSSYLTVGSNTNFGVQTYWDKDEPGPKLESACTFTRERWDEYRKIFDRLGLNWGIERKSERNHAIFFTSSIDFSDLDDSEFLVIEKGYVYSEKDINDSIVGSLDNIESDRPAIFFKKLSDHWYLYFESSIGKPC